MELWRKSVRLDPAYTQALAFMSVGHNWMGNYDSAAFWADSAVAVESNYLLGRAVTGHAAIELGDFARAESMFEAARRLATDDPANGYCSAVFDGTRGDYNLWMPSFKGYLYGRYKYNGLVRCTKKPSKAEAQKYWDDMVAAARGITLAGGAKPKIIETGWVYP